MIAGSGGVQVLGFAVVAASLLGGVFELRRWGREQRAREVRDGFGRHTGARR